MINKVSSEPNRPLNGVRVLVVDDADDAVLLYWHILRRAGAIVDAATSGAEALVKAAERHPDVILTDIVMPEMDGCEFLRLFRDANHARSQAPTPVIALSGIIGRQDGEQWPGFDGYLPKPA